MSFRVDSVLQLSLLPRPKSPLLTSNTNGTTRLCATDRGFLRCQFNTYRCSNGHRGFVIWIDFDLLTDKTSGRASGLSAVTRGTPPLNGGPISFSHVLCQGTLTMDPRNSEPLVSQMIPSIPGFHKRSLCVLEILSRAGQSMSP